MYDLQPLNSFPLNITAVNSGRIETTPSTLTARAVVTAQGLSKVLGSVNLVGATLVVTVHSSISRALVDTLARADVSVKPAATWVVSTSMEGSAVVTAEPYEAAVIKMYPQTSLDIVPTIFREDGINIDVVPAYTAAEDRIYINLNSRD